LATYKESRDRRKTDKDIGQNPQHG